MRTYLLPLFVSALSLNALPQAQSPSAPFRKISAARDSDELPPGAQPAAAQDPESAAAKAAEDAAKQKAQKRLQEFKKVVFDRRPSTVLKAWAAPELKPYDPAEEKTKDGAASETSTGGAGEARVAPEPGAPAQLRTSGGTMGGRTAGGRTAAGRTSAGRATSLTRPISVARARTGVTLRAVPAAPTTSVTIPQAATKPTATTTSSGAMSPQQIQALIDAEERGEAASPAAAGDAAAALAAASGDPKADPALEAKVLKRELEMLQRDVTLSRWDKVAEFFATFPEADRKPAYEHFLRVLLRHPNKPQQRLPANLQEKNRFSFEEALVLAGMAPGGFDRKQAAMLAPIVQRYWPGSTASRPSSETPVPSCRACCRDSMPPRSTS